MTPIQQFIDDSQAKCDAAMPALGVINIEHDAEFVYYARTALPTALQYLRELSQENELLKVHNRELRALAIERDALTRRVAELEGQVRCGWGGGPKP